MSCVGIGKTTLANEICVKWARDGFLVEHFDLVLLVPLRSAQEKPVKDVMVKYIGGAEAYKELMKSAGEKCLVIFEGLDEISIERQRTDEVLVGTLKECTMLEQAVILVTSRPHACGSVKADRSIEIVGFGKTEIQEFASQLLPNVQTIQEFLSQLNEYPHILSLCYIPINLVMIVDIYQVKKKLPSTLTELYKLFIIMIIQRQLKKGEKPSCLPVAVPVATEEMLFRLLKDIPKDAVRTVFALSRLAYYSFFSWYSNKEERPWYMYTMDPKIIFTTEDLAQCGMDVTADWDGYGLLKATPTHDLPVDTVIYNFSHLTIQEFLCAFYISTLSEQEQQHLLSIGDFPNLFIFFGGLTRLASPATSQFVFEMLKSYRETDVLTALRCVYESGETNPPQSATPFDMKLVNTTLLLYDCICVSRVLSIYSVSKLDMGLCHIGDSGAEMFEKKYSGHGLQDLNLVNNDLTVTGMKHVMKIVMKS